MSLAEGERHRITNFLKQCKNKDSNLHDHLCQMFAHIPSDKINGVVHFERISDYFKRMEFKPNIPQLETEVQKKLNAQIEYPEWIADQEYVLSKCKTLSKNENKLYQNFEKASQSLFEPVGISFGAEEAVKINAAIKLIGERENAVSMRFWGKIMGTSADYYVIQGVCNKKKEAIVKGSMEKYKQGANYYSYWVSPFIICDSWYELPLISPDQIVASRLLKYAFTGNLEADVKGYPKFPGKEKHLLKCQLVRITHNCEIVPNGLYAKGEENPDEVDFSEEFKMPEFNDLSNLENWVHLNPYILNLGRADYYKDPALSEEQREELLAKLQETDPKIDRLRGVNEDKPVEKLGMEGCWVAKQIGNLQTFNNVGKNEGTISCYAHTILRNPHWPGWTTVANSKLFGSIYIGYACKLTQDAFYPSSPEDLEMEGQDVDEIEEPNPRDPPDELEPDSDDEGKKADDE